MLFGTLNDPYRSRGPIGFAADVAELALMCLVLGVATGLSVGVAAVMWIRERGVRR